MNHFTYMKALCSPFKPFGLSFYIGKISKGVPYFYPRKWVKDKDKPGYSKAVSIKYFGFNCCGLGWKTKWDDYRFEWSPRYSLVILGVQICVTIVVENPDHYWESWLNYELRTDKKKSNVERIQKCIKEYPQTWTSHYKDGKTETTNYYSLILRDKYKKLLAI